jgi:hypothetical protein
MNDNTEISERQLTMRAIRWISRTVEALCQSVECGLPANLVRQATTVGFRCSDRVEHIAQYDDEGLDEASRMSFIAQDLYWLVQTLPGLDEIFRCGTPFRYSLDEIKALGKLAWERSGKRELPLGHVPDW